MSRNADRRVLQQQPWRAALVGCKNSRNHDWCSSKLSLQQRQGLEAPPAADDDMDALNAYACRLHRLSTVAVRVIGLDTRHPPQSPTKI